MKGPTLSWDSVLTLMILGTSFFWTLARSTSKKSFRGLVDAAPRRSPAVFGNRRGRTAAFSSSLPAHRKRSTLSIPITATTATVVTDDARSNNADQDDDNQYTPWDDPKLAERAKRDNQAFRSRQHVNPLARKFQQPTTLSDTWPRDVFSDLSKPVFLDIGCSRGGFLLDLASQRPEDYNYLGLEIRPIVVYHAKERVPKHNLEGRLDFVGCNANVDLERLLALLTTATEDGDDQIRGNVEMVTIQFPDPHFKARHAKRRVVTPELVKTLAQFMPTGATVFLQSDVQSVLDEMRLQFREQSEYFRDDHDSVEEYIPDNILGVPTERETSVIERDLPVYRARFTRTERGVH